MERGKKTNWSAEETDLLVELVPKFVSKRWKRISHQLRAKGFHRSETECREKWINFLAPEVNRREWEPWELRTLYEAHAAVGTRWCVIQKSLRRSQNQIKNRFYGTLRNFIRAILSFFDPLRQASGCPVAALSPSYLNSLYNSTERFCCLGGEVKAAIFGMEFRVDRQLLAARMQEKRQLYSELYSFLLRDFSEPSRSDQAALQDNTDHNLGNTSIGAAAPCMNILLLNQPQITIPNQLVPLFWYY